MVFTSVGHEKKKTVATVDDSVQASSPFHFHAFCVANRCEDRSDASCGGEGLEVANMICPRAPAGCACLTPRLCKVTPEDTTPCRMTGVTLHSPRAPASTRWSTTLSSKVNLLHAVNFRASFGHVTPAKSAPTKPSYSTERLYKCAVVPRRARV